ncbi:MAG: MtrB/PioB family decaheme-associated outer membrane protein, partial [Desulfuromonadales bacterium]|nr:MtrB/PioB family decaheme-associated outer membrane protein [Desulfuromonadales bacterium]
MKKFWKIAVLSLLLPAGALAQGEAQLETSGSFTVGVQQVDVDSNSSKFGEYRDLQNGVNLYDLSFLGLDTASGRYFEFNGKNLIRDDQSLRVEAGSAGTWRMSVERNEIPHNLSNKAMTPFIDQGDGLYTVPGPVQIPNTILRPNNTDSPNTYDGAGNLLTLGVLNQNDEVTAAWLETNLHKVDLGTQRDKTSATLQLTPSEFLKFRLTYSDERKDGSKITYGPIGDRPPRSLNIQFAEPIDYATREIKFEAEYNRDKYQGLFTYLLSDFNNEIDTLTWQNIYVNPSAGNDYETWVWTGNARDYNVGQYGQRALAPDNRYQNVSLAFGVDLPMASRLAGTVAYGKSEQDETLIPYATTDFGSTVDFSSTAILPRLKADAEIETKLFNVDYTINPVERLNLRAFFRYYDLDNNTAEVNWHYITQDTSPTNTDAPTYKNMRTNLAYGYDQQNYGLDATYSLNFWRTTLGLGFEREEIDREYREADTDENKYNVSIRTRPTNSVSLRAKYLYGDREADSYNNNITAESYSYVTGTDNDNPQFTFSNHPDMRRFDVTDRERQQVDLAASFTPNEAIDLSASFRWRDDDYASGVKSTQPLAGTGFAGEAAVTPGEQLGLLSSESNRYALDASFAASKQLNLSAFVARETIESTQRGLEFTENNKANPTVATTADLGAWTEARGQWEAKVDDRTNTVGAGIGYQIIPGKLNFITDYSFAYGKVDIDYSGFGSPLSTLRSGAERLDTNEFAFRNPSTVKHKQNTLNATLEYQLAKNLVFGLHYLFDNYRISDWAQESDNPWTESVGSEFLLRDTSSA